MSSHTFPVEPSCLALIPRRSVAFALENVREEVFHEPRTAD